MLARPSAAAAAFIVAGLLALPCAGDEPLRPTPAPGSLDEDRGSLGTETPPAAAPSGSAGAPAAPGSTAPSTASAPPATPRAPGSGPAAPQGSSPQGSSTPGSPPPGNYPPPGYSPRPASYPPGYSPPPGYYPPPVYGPYVVDGAKDSDSPGGKKRRKIRPSGPPDPLRKEKRTAKILMIAGISGLGAGWLLSVVHGLFGEVAGVECHSGTWGFPSCQNTDDYGPIYIPVVGPVLEAGSHRGELSGLDQGLLAVETVLQLAGVGSGIAGLALWPSSPSTTGSLPVTVSVAPTVSARSTGLAVVGTF